MIILSTQLTLWTNVDENKYFSLYVVTSEIADLWKMQFFTQQQRDVIIYESWVTSYELEIFYASCELLFASWK